MDKIWDQAVTAALEGENDHETAISEARSLILDGMLKCAELPRSGLLSKFRNLEILSLSNVGLTSLEKFPRLSNLQSLILSDNRISGSLNFLVDAELVLLRKLVLANNRIQSMKELEPLSRLGSLETLDLYDCPVTQVEGYREKTFDLVKSLRYLDNKDMDGNDRPESEDEEDDEDNEDLGIGEVDGDDNLHTASNGCCDATIDTSDDDESGEDEEATEDDGTVMDFTRNVPSGSLSLNGKNDRSNDGEDHHSEEEIDDDNVDEDSDEDDVVEVPDKKDVSRVYDNEEEEDDDDECEEFDFEDDAVEVPGTKDVSSVHDDDTGGENEYEDFEFEDDMMEVPDAKDVSRVYDDGEGDDNEYEEFGVADDGDKVDNDHEDGDEFLRVRQTITKEGEIDGHDNKEDGAEGEQGVEDANEFCIKDGDVEEDDEESEEGFLVQPVEQDGSRVSRGTVEEDAEFLDEDEDTEGLEEVDDVYDDYELQALPPVSKRKRDEQEEDLEPTPCVDVANSSKKRC